MKLILLLLFFQSCPFECGVSVVFELLFIVTSSVGFWFCVCSLFSYTILIVLSIFAIILKGRERAELVALL